MNNDNNFTEHPIRIFVAYGQLKLDHVPPSVSIQIRKLFDETANSLHEALRVADALQKTDMSIYKPSYAKKEIANQLLGPRKKLHEILRKHFAHIEEGLQHIENRKQELCKPKISEKTNEAIAQSMKFQEIRQLLRAMPYNQRIEEITANIENGNGSYLLAVSDGPDSIVHEKSLKELQDKYVDKVEPNIKPFERQFTEIKKFIRQKAAEINSTQLEILRSKGFDNDPLPEEEHFQTFTPQTENEESIARQRIQRQMNKIREEENKERFDKENGGRSL